MLAPSKPKSMNTLRAPSRICRRFEVSSSPTIRKEVESAATIGLGSRERIKDWKGSREGHQSSLCHRLYLDRTVRSMVMRGKRYGMEPIAASAVRVNSCG